MDLVARGCDMTKKALKIENERLQAELLKASRTVSHLRLVNMRYEDEIKQLRGDLTDAKEKYAALLEKYIAAMEARVKE